MGTLEQVTKMREEGMNDEDIIYNLREQGISPKSISDALNQASIKAAVTGIRGDSLVAPQNEDYAPQEFYSLPENSQKERYAPENEEQESYSPSENYKTKNAEPPSYYSPQETYTPAAQDNYLAVPQQSYPQETYAPEQYQDPHAQQAYSGYAPNTSTETLIDIAQQVVSEKTAEIRKRLDELEEFRTLAQTRIDYISERVKRIDLTLDKLQIAILDKVGSYSSTLEGIKKEMSMMQESFSKTLNPLLDLAENSFQKSNRIDPAQKLRKRN